MFLGLDIGPPGQGCLQNCVAMSACRSHPLDFKVRKLGLMHEIREITLSVCFPLAEDGTSHISGGVLRSGSTGGGGGGGGANSNVWPHSHAWQGGGCEKEHGCWCVLTNVCS